MPWVPEGVAVFKNAENVDAAKYFVEWLFSSDDHLRQLAEIEQKNGIKVIKPSIEVRRRYPKKYRKKGISRCPFFPM